MSRNQSQTTPPYSCAPQEMATMAALVLLLPGWHNSGPEHWQSRWELAQGYERVQQHDWECPLRGDWLMQLEAAVLTGGGSPSRNHRDGSDKARQPKLESAPDFILVAHGLGCQQVAAWAAHTRNAQRIRAALLVAPSDVQREDVGLLLPSWLPMTLQELGFQSILVASRNDPFCSFNRSQQFAQAWGSELLDLGQAGHINAQSGLGEWPLGHGLLQRLQMSAGSEAAMNNKIQ